VTGEPALYSALSITSSGLAITSGHSYAIQWVADGTRFAQASTTAITVSGGDVKAATLDLSGASLVALFAGTRRSRVTGTLYVWDTTDYICWARGQLAVEYSPNPADEA